MPRKLARGDFWDRFLVNTSDGAVDMATCPKCGCLINNIDLHIDFHRELGNG